jgi:flagellar basal-body rod protein FlgF
VDNIAYIGLSRQTTLQKQMDVIANNIANMDTAGFKVEELMTKVQPGGPAKDAEINGPAQFSMASGLARDFSEGELSETGRSTDVAIDGPGFFKISTPQGERYTRDGRFGLDAQGKLVNANGHPVLDDSGGEITLDPSNGAPQISADGIISQRSKQGSTSTRVGKIGVVKFDTLSVLQKEGDNSYSNTSNAQPIPATEARLRQGMVESSNVKPIVEITNLIQVQRAYERISNMVQQTNDLSQSSIDRLAKVA